MNERSSFIMNYIEMEIISYLDTISNNLQRVSVEEAMKVSSAEELFNLFDTPASRSAYTRLNLDMIFKKINNILESAKLEDEEILTIFPKIREFTIYHVIYKKYIVNRNAFMEEYNTTNYMKVTENMLKVPNHLKYLSEDDITKMYEDNILNHIEMIEAKYLLHQIKDEPRD